MPLLARCLTAIDVVGCCLYPRSLPIEPQQPDERGIRAGSARAQSATDPTRPLASTLTAVKWPPHTLSGDGLAAANWGRNQPAPTSSSSRSRPDSSDSTGFSSSAQRQRPQQQRRHQQRQFSDTERKRQQQLQQQRQQQQQ